jgi:hypothetical protein
VDLDYADFTDEDAKKALQKPVKAKGALKEKAKKEINFDDE